MVIPSSLDDLTEHADLIVMGTVTARETAAEPFKLGGHIAMSTYTLSVSEVLKNTTSATVEANKPFVFRQKGGPLPAGFKKPIMRRVSAVTYENGENVLLFLIRQGTGDVWSPVGLSQGKFTVETAPDGSQRVLNGAQNKYLFPPQPPVTPGKSAAVVSKGTAAYAASSNGAIDLDIIRDDVRVKSPMKGGAQ